MERVLPAPVRRQAGSPNVRLSLSNRPENVALVRQMLAGVAEAIGLDAIALNDISTAATEACNNVVLHAYEGAEGPLQIDVSVGSEALEVVVRDHGSGIRPQFRRSDEVSGIGLSVIQALARRAEFGGTTDDHGTEVRMTFATPPLAMEMSIAPASLARTILPRLLSVFAARAHFTTDRLADVQLVADALAAHVPGSITGGHLSLGASVEPHDLELRIAPLRAGCANQLIADSALDGLAPVIERLTHEQQVKAVGGSSEAEMLALRLTDRR